MTDEKKEQIIDKLRKLRAHQKSAEQIGSEDEAQAFAAAFKRILDNHKLDMSDIEWEEEKKQPIVRVYVSHKAAGLKTSKVRVAWMLDLARQIGIAHQCAILWGRSTRDFWFVGHQISAEAAREVYGYMVKVAETLAEKEYVKFFYKCKNELGDVRLARGYKQGFLFGFTGRLRQRYEEELKKLEQGHTGSALIRLSDALTLAKKSLEEDDSLSDIRVATQKKPDNIFGVLDGMKKADEVKFGAERLRS